jgi:prolyl 4-hydroxylase
MSGQQLDDIWVAWLQQNLARKCDPKQLLEILLKNGFSEQSVREHMGTLFPAGSPLFRHILQVDKVVVPDYKALSEIRITRKIPGLNAEQVLTPKLQLYMLDAFMSNAECDRIIKISSEYLRPSTVTTGDRDKGYRTSSTSDLSLLNHPYVQKIEEKIARAAGICLPYSEGIQVQRYEVGQGFGPHTDYFEPGTHEYATYAGNRGQHTWTFMVYLNEGMKGGGTKFFAIDKVFTPKKGAAVIWNNLRPDGSPNHETLHSGLAVEAGNKIVITKWFREGGRGAMFYET